MKDPTAHRFPLPSDPRPTFPLLPEEKYDDGLGIYLEQATRIVTVTWRCGHTQEDFSASTEESRERLKMGTLFLCTDCWVRHQIEKRNREA